MAYAIWRETALRVAGITIPCQTAAITMPTNPQKIMLADGTKTGNALKGYSKGKAQPGFNLRTTLFSGINVAFFNAILATTPFDVEMQFGDAGGESATGFLLTDFEIAWSAGSEPLLTAAFRNNAVPTPGATVAAPTGYGDPFHNEDVTLVTLPGGNHTKLHSFSFKITRTLGDDYGNDPNGLPFTIDQISTEVTIEAEYRKESAAEQNAFGGTGCPTVAACGVILTQVCPTDGTPVTLALDIADGFHTAWPEVVPPSGIEGVTYEKAVVMSASGAFTLTSN